MCNAASIARFTDSSEVSLALKEAQAPVGGHVGAANDAGQLVHDFERCGAHKEVEVQNTTNHSVLQLVLGDGYVHAIAVHQHHTMRQPICSHKQRCVMILISNTQHKSIQRARVRQAREVPYSSKMPALLRYGTVSP